MMQSVVMRQSLAATGAGLLVGLGAALALTQLLRGLLFEIEPRDPTTLSAVAIVVTGCALVAGFLPARHAAQIEPSITLRHE